MHIGISIKYGNDTIRLYMRRMEKGNRTQPASDIWIMVHARHASAFCALFDHMIETGAMDNTPARGYKSGMACVAGFRLNLGDKAIQSLLSVNNIPFHIIGRVAGDAVFFDSLTIHWVVNHETCIKVMFGISIYALIFMYISCSLFRHVF
jgi:hypothetical protein